MMKKILNTNPGNTTALLARLAIGIAIFPHGAQKLLGWFGGGGFDGTMGFLNGAMGLPYIIALLVVLIEFFGSLMLIMGFATRVAALGILGNFLGVVATSQFGFFMNWARVANKTEGLEYFILLFALTLISLIAGGGRWSVDAQLTKAPGLNTQSAQ